MTSPVSVKGKSWDNLPWFTSVSMQICQSDEKSVKKFLICTKSDFETGKGCVFNEQNLPVSKTHSLVIKPQEVNFK